MLGLRYRAVAMTHCPGTINKHTGKHTDVNAPHKYKWSRSPGNCNCDFMSFSGLTSVGGFEHQWLGCGLCAILHREHFLMLKLILKNLSQKKFIKFFFLNINEFIFIQRSVLLYIYFFQCMSAYEAHLSFHFIFLFVYSPLNLCGCANKKRTFEHE